MRETSRRPLLGRGSAPVGKTMEDVKRDFSDIVLQPGLQVCGVMLGCWVMHS